MVMIKSKKTRIIFITAVAVCLLAVIAAVLAIALKHQNQSDVPDIPTSAEGITEEEPDTAAPDALLGAFIAPGVDFTLSDGWQQQVDSLIDTASQDGYTCVFVPLMGDEGAFYASNRFARADENDYIEYIAKSAHDRSVMVYISFDPTRSADGIYDVSDDESLQAVTAEITNVCMNYGVDGIALRSADVALIKPSYANYAAQGGSMGYDEYCRRSYAQFVRKLCGSLRKSGCGVCIGAAIPADNMATAQEWTDNGALDFVLVTDNSTDVADGGAFYKMADEWLAAFSGKKPLYFALDSLGVSSHAVSQNTLIAQAEHLISAGNNGFVQTSALAAKELKDLKISLSAAKDESFGIRELSITSPSSSNYVTYSDSVSFIGAFDPLYPLVVNGEQISHTDTGYFSFDAKLKAGKNTFVFEHKGSVKTYTVEYKNIIIKSIYPSKEQWVNGGTSVTVSAVARNGSDLWARLGGEVKHMVSTGGASNDSADVFSNYAVTFVMPQADDVPVEVGSLVVTATLNGESETKAGGKICVRAKNESSDNVTSVPADAAYESGYGITVGEGDRYVAEVCVYQTETLDIINPTDERSRPTNAYLPMGTVDYCTDNDELYYNPESGNTNAFRNLDYGKRVYSDDNIRIFKAILPETNAITAVNCTNNGRHTVITFDTAWKAPFNVTLSPQSYTAPYKNSGRPDYSISDTTYEYVDIEFCYTASGQGAVDLTGNPVFSRGEWVKGERGYYVLRLWLRQKGMFYGWTAEYNEKNQLVFSFLNPVQITESNNYYGYSLKGVKIVVDAGHGGKSSPGAVGSSKQYTEAVLNLILARKVQRELENLGATVIMTRTADTTLSLDDRNKITVAEKPDLFISIHRNSSASSSTRGYENFYFYPYSKSLADAVYATSVEQYSEGRGAKFYPFYVTRVSCCPAILTENGFMSNSADLEMIKTDEHNEKMAVSITQGIVDYLASIKHN